MLGSFPPELMVVLQQPVYSGRRSRRCHVISYRPVTINLGIVASYLAVWGVYWKVTAGWRLPRCRLFRRNLNPGPSVGCRYLPVDRHAYVGYKRPASSGHAPELRPELPLSRKTSRSLRGRLRKRTITHVPRISLRIESITCSSLE